MTFIPSVLKEIWESKVKSSPTNVPIWLIGKELGNASFTKVARVEVPLHQNVEEGRGGAGGGGGSTQNGQRIFSGSQKDIKWQLLHLPV